MEHPENSFDPIAGTAPLPDFSAAHPQPEAYAQPEAFPQPEALVQPEEYAQPEEPVQPDVSAQLDEFPQMDASAFQPPEPVKKSWVPEALSQPIEFSGGQIRKEFGAMVLKKKKSVGVGYVMAGLCIPLLVWLFFPLVGGVFFPDGQASISFFSLLKTFFGPEADWALTTLLAESGFLSTTGSSFEGAAFAVRLGGILLFVLPPVIALLSLISRGLTRFFLVLLPVLFGGGSLIALHSMVNSLLHPGQSGFHFLEAVDLPILIYFLILVLAFLGSIPRKVLARRLRR